MAVVRTHSPTHSSTALLSHLARIAQAHTETSLGALGLRPRHLVTLTLLAEIAPATQQALAQRLAIDRTNLVGLLNELESAGLLARRRDAADRRRHIVELTEAGRETLDRAERALEAAEAEVLGALSGVERCQLYELLQRAAAGQAPDCEAAAGVRDDIAHVCVVDDPA